MSGQNSWPFDIQLMGHIMHRRNVEAKSMISEDLAKVHDEFGTLLHYTASYGNEVITEYLVELGSEIDALGKDGKTPLILAAAGLNEKIVKTLLEAKADIDIVDDSGGSALQMVFREDYVTANKFKMFLDKIQADAPTIEELVSKLVSTGCTLHHATYLKDVKILECMLARGYDINSRGPWQQTALHAAAWLDDLGLAKWLVDRGADVNALDRNDSGPLMQAAERGSKEMLQFLLEQGANPNTIDLIVASTPLSVAVECSISETQYAECVEILLQYGAIPRNSDQNYSLFDGALLSKSSQVTGMLIGHLAVLERLGTFVADSVIRCNVFEHREALGEIKKEYELCQQTLDFVVFGTSTLFDLLMESEEKMKIHVRKETFMPKIGHFCSEYNLSKSCSYYYNKLMKSVSRADYLVKLENRAIPVICDLFDGDYNQCYIAAKEVCDYLDESDLVQLGCL